LMLEMPARMTFPDPRLDASRGCVAIERGPLVYCLETVDLPADVQLEEVELDPAAEPDPVARPDLGPEVIGLTVPARRRGDGPLEVGAIPYLAWAHRSVQAMRVWIPQGSSSAVLDRRIAKDDGVRAAGEGSDGDGRAGGHD